MQIKTTRYHLTPVRMTIIKKIKITNVGKDVEKREPLCTVGRSVNMGAATIENREVPQKIKHKTTT